MPSHYKDKKKKKGKKHGGYFGSKRHDKSSGYIKQLEDAADTRSQREKDQDAMFEFDD